MKHIVFMARNYYPYCTAVGVCLGNVADVVAKVSRVTIVCEKSKLYEDSGETHNGCQIVRVVSKSTGRRQRLQERIEHSHGMAKVGYEAALFGFRCLEYARSILSPDSARRDLVNEYLRALEDIRVPMDVIVPTCMPFESIMAAEIYKRRHSGVEVVPYLFDKFSENRTLHRTRWNKKLKMKNNLALEKSALEASDRILYTPSWVEHLGKHFAHLGDKFRPVEHPLLRRIEVDDLVHYGKDRINIVFAGSVMLSGRNPGPTLRMLDAVVARNTRVFVHFYAAGNAVGMLEKFAREHKACAAFYGRVRTETALSAAANASILLSIGNADITQIPSKVFEYMACRKPIVHVAVSGADPVLGILESYPLACSVCLETDSLERQISKVDAFVRQSSGTEVEFAMLEELFPTALPEYSAAFIVHDHLVSGGQTQ